MAGWQNFSKDQRETINLVLTGSDGNEHYDAAVAYGVVGGSEVGTPCHNARQVSVESIRPLPKAPPEED